MDKTLLNIISMILGAVGLIGAITKYDFPKARKTVYGENLFALKENIVNNFVVWYFTLYAAFGLFIQVVFGEVFADGMKDRLHDNGFYLMALIVSLGLIASLIPILKSLSRWVSKSYWHSEIVPKAKANFLLAKELYQIDANKNLPENPKALQITDWLEELFEIKSNKRDLKSRLDFFNATFR